MGEGNHDCIIVGGGPAGLTAAIYLARFHLSTLVVDAGGGRARMIPRTHNHAGYPGGIVGTELVARMEEQARLYGAEIVTGTADHLAQEGERFVVGWDGGRAQARAVLLATGVVNRRPRMDDALHDEALARGLFRYCPVCDGYEVTDARVAVVGRGERGCNEALFLRGFTRDVTLIAPEATLDLAPEMRARLDAAGVRLVDGPAHILRIDGDRLVTASAAGELAFDSIYPALGSDIRSELARQLGADMSEDGCLAVDDHQRTSVPGLYAAGDVVQGLDQISHAMGEGGVAATTMRNDLAKAGPLLR